MFMIPRLVDGGDLVFLAFIITCQPHRPEVVPVFGPAGFQVLRVNGFQIGIAREVGLSVIDVERTELLCRRVVDPSGIT